MGHVSRFGGLTFDEFRKANVTRCVKWHPAGIESWSPSDWLTAVTGELGELASLLKMRNRERDGLPGNKFSPSEKQVADELADVLTYLDLLAAALGVDLGAAAVQKFNEVSERVGFPDRIAAASENSPQQSVPERPERMPCKHGVRWPHDCSDCEQELAQRIAPASSERATNAALQEVEDALWTLHSYESNRDDAGRSYSEAEITKMVSAIRALAPNSAKLPCICPTCGDTIVRSSTTGA